MKKKVLFIIPNLKSGGAEKSLINLLSVFDYGKYEVDLFLLDREGIFLKNVPDAVTILEPSKNLKVFSKPLFSSCLQYFLSFQWHLVFHRFMFALKNKVYTANKAEQYGWNNYRAAIGKFAKQYDAAFGYLEKTSIYCCCDLVDSKKKIGFIRVDYMSLKLDAHFDRRYFKRLDYLCANGKLSLDILEKIFPDLHSKLRLVINVTLPSSIVELSKEGFPLDASKINIVTIGRLNIQKGYELAIGACRILADKGYDIVWTVIGEGQKREELTNLITENNLQKHFVLIGEKENPYPYISQATIYAQTSLYEGKSNTINEAKILQKPILATDFDTVFEQISNNENGLIVARNAEAIAEGLIELIDNKILRDRFSEKLSEAHFDYSKALAEYYKLIEG